MNPGLSTLLSNALAPPLLALENPSPHLLQLLATPACIFSSQKIFRHESRALVFSGSLPSLFLILKFSLQPGPSASVLELLSVTFKEPKTYTRQHEITHSFVQALSHCQRQWLCSADPRVGQVLSSLSFLPPQKLPNRHLTQLPSTPTRPGFFSATSSRLWIFLSFEGQSTMLLILANKKAYSLYFP